jgi:hypothetical protein
VRYYSYDRTIRGATDVPWIILAAPVRPPYRVQANQKGWLFKGEADYRVTHDIMIYALATEGMRPGGANQTIGLPAELVVYRGDKLWNYEVGAKTSLFDRRLTLNGDIFQIDWKDMQVSGSTPDGFYSYITNVGASRVRGGELEANLRVSHALSLFGNATYLDAKLTVDQINNYIVAAGRKGDRLPYIPHFTRRGELFRPFIFRIQADQPLPRDVAGLCTGEPARRDRVTERIVGRLSVRQQRHRFDGDQPGIAKRLHQQLCRDERDTEDIRPQCAAKVLGVTRRFRWMRCRPWRLWRRWPHIGREPGAGSTRLSCLVLLRWAVLRPESGSAW